MATLTGTGVIFGNSQRTDTELVQVGSILLFAYATISSIEGYLPCNGSAVSRSTYSALFSAIGTTYGAGNGSTTFNVPDFRGYFLRGFDSGRGVSGTNVRGTVYSGGGRVASHGHGPNGIQSSNHTHWYQTFGVSSDHSHWYARENSANVRRLNRDNRDNRYGFGANTGGIQFGQWHFHGIGTNGPSSGHTHAIPAEGSSWHPRNKALNFGIRY